MYDAPQGHDLQNQNSPTRPAPHRLPPLPAMSTTRQIDIRVGAVKRLTKEFKSRIVDIETEKQRTERLIDAGEDRWTVGKQVVPVSKAFSRFAVYVCRN